MGKTAPRVGLSQQLWGQTAAPVLAAGVPPPSPGVASRGAAPLASLAAGGAATLAGGSAGGAAVCRSWREVTKEVVKTLEECGRITFPISLKQPGPREHPVQCFVRRDRATSTYLLYLGVSPY